MSAALNYESGAPILLTGSGQVSKSPGNLVGFYVNSTTGGTIVITDSNAATGGTTLSGTITPVIGFHKFPVACVSGCYATLANTISVTFFFAA